MASIYSAEWWQPYLPQLRREFADVTMDILIAGGDAGAGSIRAGSVLVDWDVFNEDALTWLDMYLGATAVPGLTAEGAYAWAWSLNETTRRNVVREIDRWVRSGAPLPELEKRLGLYFDDRRARRIAATEVTRIYASGNVIAWKASGVVDGKRWQTARDERVCPVCGKLHGKLVDLNRGWEFSAAMLEENPALKKAIRAPMTVIVPPAHVACVLPGNKIVTPGLLSAAAKSFYHGKAIEITVKSGRVLTVTENHPILTPVGYVAAGLLRKGGYVISARDAEGIAAAVNPDNNHIPTAIEQVYRAFKESPFVVSRRVPAAAEYFHGDGRAVDGDIDVVYIDRLLERDGVAAFPEQVGKFVFSGDSVASGSLLRLRHSDFSLMGDNLISGSFMSGGDLLPPLVIRHERPFQEFGFGSAAWLNSSFEQAPTNSPAVDPQIISDGLFGFTSKVAGNDAIRIEGNPVAGSIFQDTGAFHDAADDFGRHAFLAGQFVERFTGLVAADEVVSVRKFNFSGHVYDLQCDDYELYITEGVITSNCRCWLQPVVFDAMTPEEIDAMRWQ